MFSFLKRKKGPPSLQQPQQNLPEQHQQQQQQQTQLERCYHQQPRETVIASEPSIRLNTCEDVRDIVVLRDGTFLVRSSEKHYQRWSPSTGELLNTYVGEQSYSVAELDDDTIVTSDVKGLMVWNKHDSTLIKAVDSSEKVMCLLKLRSRPSSLLAGMNFGKLVEWGTDTLEIVGRTEEGHTKGHVNYTRSVLTMCELSNGTVVSGSMDSSVKGWNMDTKRCIKVFNGHWGAVYSVVELIPSTTIATASVDYTIRIWNVKTAQCLRKMEEHKRHVIGLVKMWDGRLVSGSMNESLQVWNADGECVSTLHVPGCRVTSVALLKNGSIVFGGSGHIEVRETWLR